MPLKQQQHLKTQHITKDQLIQLIVPVVIFNTVLRLQQLLVEHSMLLLALRLQMPTPHYLTHKRRVLCACKSIVSLEAIQIHTRVAAQFCYQVQICAKLYVIVMPIGELMQRRAVEQIHKDGMTLTLAVYVFPTQTIYLLSTKI